MRPFISEYRSVRHVIYVFGNFPGPRFLGGALVFANTYRSGGVGSRPLLMG